MKASVHIAMLVGSLIAILAFTLPADAQLDTGDVILDIQNQQVVTGTATNDGIAFPNFIWSQNFGSSFDNFANDPGYDSPTDTFTTGHVVSIAIRKALRVWNDQEGDFGDIPQDVTMTIERASSMIETPSQDPEQGAPLPTLALAAAGSTGKIHVHPWYGLTSPHTDGVYLLELEASVSTSGIDPSEPFWIVFNQNTPSAMVDDAVAWVEENLTGQPCPGDINDDGAVNVDDLLMVLNAWGPCEACPADITGDGNVNVDDLLMVLNAWGECP